MAWETVYTPPASDMPGTDPGEQRDDRPWGEKARDAAEYYDRMTRLGINTFTFGMADRAAAVGKTLTGGSPSYSDALKEVTDESELIRKNNPQMSVAADVTGGVAGGLGLAKLGLTVMPRVANAPWWGRSLAAGGEAAVQGGLQGAGNTYSGNPMDYAENTGKGAALGGVLGLGTPVLGQLGGAAYRAVADQGFRGGIPGTLAKAAQNDVVGLRTLPRRGDAAMLPDAGPSMLGAAQGAVTGTEGPGATSLVRNLKARDAASPARVTAEVDQTYGPAPTPSYVERGVRERMQAMSPEYDRALAAAGPVNTQGIDNRLRLELNNAAGDVEKAIIRVRGMLDSPTTPGAIDQNAVRINSVRTAVRGMRDDPKADPEVAAAMGRVYRHLTQELEATVPNYRNLRSQYAELGQQEAAVQPGNQGSRAFIKDREGVVRPNELQDTMTEAVQPKGSNVGPSAEAFRIRQSTRGELDRIVGTNKNDLLALENVLGKPQDWNAQKLEVMFGRDRAARMFKLLDDERVFRDTYQKVAEGSQTAQRIAAKEGQERTSGKIPKGVTASDLILQPIQWAKDKLTATGAANTRDRIAQIMATNNPAEVRALIPRLLAAEPNRARREQIIRNLVQSGAIGGAGGVVPSNRGPMRK